MGPSRQAIRNDPLSLNIHRGLMPGGRRNAFPGLRSPGKTLADFFDFAA